MHSSRKGDHAGAAPVGLPILNRAQGKVVEPSVCKTELPGASPGCASIYKRHIRVLAGGRKPIRLSRGQEKIGALPVGPTTFEAIVQ